jgi:eukaryotic-like serine/threonine-protein kinase
MGQSPVPEIAMSVDPPIEHQDAATQPPEPRQTKPAGRQATSVGGSEAAGTRIGPYKLLQRIGEGGMGTVWMAEQTEPVKRRVAVKLIKVGMDSQQVLARFEAERQALALMDHPSIARVLDAGTTENGRPFFVMEMVKGVPITKYCDDHHLPPKERLQLFIQVCNAIQHAHHKGIIHRDIKPSNVLVGEYDGKPLPKVIDFGLAKATAQSLTERTLVTNFGGILGTIEYMSPEQTEFNSMDIDTRADIYALGVMLYELLTGTTPLSGQRPKQAALDEVLRLVREGEPPKPSSRLTESKDSLTVVAAQRMTEPMRLTRLVRGELDWLVMKALEKDRNRRYDTANAFALDIQRYLKDEPVLASPPSTLYRMRKFAKRNKGSLVAAALVLLALVGGIVGTTLGLLQAREQRDAADVARQTAETQRDRAVKAEDEARAVLGFFESKVLAAARPKGQDGGLGIDATIRAAADAAEPKIGDGFRDNPLVEASIRAVLGSTYYFLGEANLAIRQHQRALELRKSHLPAEHPDTLVSMNHLASAYLQAGRINDALPLFEQTLKVRRATLGPEHRDTLESMNNLAAAYQLGKRYKDAVPLYKETLKLRTETLGAEHPKTLDTMTNLALAYQATGRHKDALPLLEETLRLQRANQGEKHLDALGTMNNLALALWSTKRLSEAVPLYDETLKLAKDLLGPEHPNTLTCMKNHAECSEEFGRWDLAEPSRRDLAANSKSKAGPDSVQYADKLNLLGFNLLHQKKDAEAEPVLRNCLAIIEKKQPDNFAPFYIQILLGSSLLGQKKYADAEPLLMQGYEGMKKRAANMPPQAQSALTASLEWIVELYEATDQKDKVTEWRQKLEEQKR